MPNIKTKIDEWEVKDLEDNSTISVTVHNTQMGNKELPGVQVYCMGQIINYEPMQAERWAYEAAKAKQEEFLLESQSWVVYNDTFMKYYFIPGTVPKAKVEVKVKRKATPVVKEYDLPFVLEN